MQSPLDESHSVSLTASLTNFANPVKYIDIYSLDWLKFEWKFDLYIYILYTDGFRLPTSHLVKHLICAGPVKLITSAN